MTAEGTVRVGVTPGPDPDAGQLWAVVDVLEDMGYDSIWLSDRAGRGGLAPLPALAAVAARTAQLKLGTSVLVMPPRDPLLLAGELATIDVLSGGRLLPAGGLGIDAEVDVLDRGPRGARMEETIDVLHALWSGRPVDYQGVHYRLEGVTLAPAPTRERIEFWLGGRVPAALRRVGRVADGWLASFVAPEAFGGAVDQIRAAAAEADRSIDADHYGATIFAQAPGTPLPPEYTALIENTKGLDPAGVAAEGPAATLELLRRFIAAGASKFVVVPVADDPVTWLEELYDEVVAPVEATPVAAA